MIDLISLVIDHSPSAGVPFSWISPKKNGTHILSLQMPAYKIIRNPNLPQSLPILFHSSYPLESFTSTPPPPTTTLPFPNHPSICSGSPNPTRSWWDTIQVEGAQQAIIPAGKIPKICLKMMFQVSFSRLVGYGIVPLEGYLIHSQVVILLLLCCLFAVKIMKKSPFAICLVMLRSPS